ncbi:zinc-ribbon domain-containing protein [bacterium]|nr:zinc-ribbon domain-containing protein [bacterium]
MGTLYDYCKEKNKEYLLQEWDYELNKELNPEIITPSSHKQAWWKCSKCGYKWQTRITNRTHQETGCPACAGSILLVGVNDLATKYPKITQEWNFERNANIFPQDIRPGSHKKYWWKCSKCGYEWLASPNNRTNHNSQCPKCTQSSGHIKGITDFATSHPEIAKEWHPTKNKNVLPNSIKAGSNKKVWWQCKTCGKSWQATVYSRVKGGNCPHCWHSMHTSFPEQAIYYYIQKLYPDTLNRYKAEFLGRMELDIYIPSLKWGIEYDGKAWHKEDKRIREQKKYKLCKEKGIKLIRIREQMTPLGSDIADDEFGIVKFNNKESLEETIKDLIKRINFTGKRISINLDRDETEIRSMYQGKIKDSLEDLYPDVAKEWHPTKNGILKPNNFNAGSEYKAWWLCSTCGYEWETSIKQRTGKKLHNCPQCSHQTIVIGKNDLATTHPFLAKEWHSTKNGNLTPKDIITGWGKKFWWKCSKCGYEWQATAAHRKFSNSGCPFCANKVLVTGINDLETKAPHIAKEWDYEKNAPIIPSQIHSGSNKKVWWICSICGKSWQATISSRTHYNRTACHSCNLTKGRKRVSQNDNQLHLEL